MRREDDAADQYLLIDAERIVVEEWREPGQ
jgi:hypothetical protein